MDKIFASLLESDILTQDTKDELMESIKTQMETAINEAKAEAEAEVRAQLTKEFIEEKEKLVEAIDTKAEEYLQKEIGELKEDISNFRDLEVEYADRLVEHKAAMAETLKADLEELVEAIDVFVEMRLTAELQELSESIEEVRKNQFGLDVYNIFEGMYVQQMAGSKSEENTMAKLQESENKLEETQTKLNEAEKKLAQIERSTKMVEVLKDLSGRNKEVMEAILKSVPTAQLDEAYKNYIPRVLHESANVDDTEKEDKVLAESNNSTKEATVKTIDTEGTVKVQGNSDTVVSEGFEDRPKLDAATLNHIRVLSGIKEK
jgi:hypothetical protein